MPAWITETRVEDVRVVNSLIIYLLADVMVMFCIEIVPLNILRINKHLPALRWS